MIKKITVLFYSFCLTCTLMAQTRAEQQTLSNEIKQELEGNILPFWLKNATDSVRGGFYGEISSLGAGNPKAPKSAILGARILWTFSSAYRLSGIEEYKRMADGIQQYYIQHFIDPVYGGSYWSIKPEGGIDDATKQTYATAFGIYALSEHFRATGCKQSLNAAQALFETLEKKVHDHERGGYREVFSCDYTTANVKGVDGRLAPKTMNTHIHVLEAYTNLYKVWPDVRVKACLEELISILETHLYDAKTGHLILFCDDDWKSLEPVDSYGHDIETSWLLCEAAEALDDETLLSRIKKQAVKMADVAIKDGMRQGGVMIYEKDKHGVNERQSWWVQAEAVVGCLNAWQITGQRKYYDQAVETWQYIKAHFVDRKGGDWWRNLDAKGNPNTRESKASMWNCPYHSSRMCYEAVRRLAPVAVHSEVMAWSNITGIRSEGELIDFESTLRVGTPGATIEATGRERQQNVRYRREEQTQIVDIPLHGAHFHQEVTDVDQQHIRIRWTAEADTSLVNKGAYFCMELAPKYYAYAKIKTSDRKVTIKSAERQLTLTLNQPLKTFVRRENGCQVLYITFMPSLVKGKKVEAEALLTIAGKQHHEKVSIALDIQHPGARFAGFGGNFRIQNPTRDPEVIDYCLDNLRVAFGRAEFPWASWDAGGKSDPRVIASAKMAQRLKSLGMPLVISCWFPPQWALMPGQKRGSGGVAALKLNPAQKERIYDSMASYLQFLKTDYGVEADYFSFNESDIGIDVLHSPEEHCEFIKEFGAKLASLHLPCKMLLGDNSDATTINFIQPALKDPEAHRYIGAVSFHSWRGCDDQTLCKWRDAARSINVPLIVGEGSTDAAAWRYPAIFSESTFALYEINLYTRLCAICQPLSILQWQLTADYSLLRGHGILGDKGPLRPTQRYYNLKQLSMTPADALTIPVMADKENVNTAAFCNLTQGKVAVHIVNNGASCQAEITGLPENMKEATVFVTNAQQNAEAKSIAISNGKAIVTMPAESFVSLIIE